MLAHPVLVGTFHKTGTSLMRKVFREVAKKHALRFWRRSKDREPDAWDICFDDHSSFLEAGLLGKRSRCVISIRDPRDIVISAARYHVWAREPWLDVPRRIYNGRSYREAIASLPTERERFIFEMDNSSGGTIKRMLAIDQADERILVVRLDDLIVDRDYVQFGRIFRFLGFSEEVVPSCLAVARRHSLFDKKFKSNDHVQHTTPALWRTEFDDDLNAEFASRFGSAIEQLGYPS